MTPLTQPQTLDIQRQERPKSVASLSCLDLSLALLISLTHLNMSNQIFTIPNWIWALRRLIFNQTSGLLWFWAPLAPIEGFKFKTVWTMYFHFFPCQVRVSRFQQAALLRLLLLCRLVVTVGTNGARANRWARMDPNTCHRECQIRPEYLPDQTSDVMSEYMSDRMSVGGNHSKKVCFSMFFTISPWIEVGMGLCRA